jgi:hypothetical protein
MALEVRKVENASRESPDRAVLMSVDHEQFFETMESLPLPTQHCMPSDHRQIERARLQQAKHSNEVSALLSKLTAENLPKRQRSAQCGFDKISVAARAASASVGALVLAAGITGIAEASATLSPRTLRTSSAESVTCPIAQVPTGW